ncbi:diguanylate cyclase (GGDEF) domain-containing protein [Lachnospiraceae bacterium XPB1003]|nr:diguanylate cyclase (GGDEF) domain-containing protein [Lachnospiraceae bacterium XPB1003]
MTTENSGNQANESNIKDGLGLLGSAPVPVPGASLLGTGPAQKPSEVCGSSQDNASGVPGDISADGADDASLSEDEALLDNIFSITNELYAQMRDPSTGVEEDHMSIFRLLTDLGRRLVNADRASLWRVDNEAHTIWTLSATDEGRIVIPEGSGMVGKALAEGKTLVTNDPYHDPFFNADVDKSTGYVTKSILVMPVTNSRGEYIGAYQVINKLDGDGKFNSRRDCKRLSLAAFICSLTLESELFLADAESDRLTKVRNRVGFYHDFNMRYGTGVDRRNDAKPGSMIMCDIDHFKLVNDTYGHNAGDAVLRHVSRMLVETSRKTDTVYRWGGEEFVVLLDETDIFGAARAAEKIRAAIEESTCIFEGTAIQVTVSFGCCVVNPNMTAEENIAVADKRLYNAKESGRNRVVMEG